MTEQEIKQIQKQAKNKLSVQQEALKAQKAVVKSLLLDYDREAFYEIKVSESDFEDDSLKALFNLCMETLSVGDGKEDMYAKMNANQQEYVNILLDTPLMSLESAQMVLESYSARKKLEQFYQTGLSELYGKHIDDIMAYLEQMATEMGQKVHEAYESTIIEGMMEALDSVDKALFGQKNIITRTGFTDLDAIIGGFMGGEFMVFGAPSSHGKTAFALSCALNQILEGKVVGYFSFEMNKKALSGRLATMNSHKHGDGNYQIASFERLSRGIGTKEEFDVLIKSGTEVANQKMLIYEGSRLDINRLCAIATKWKQVHNLDVLYVDYIQLLTGAKSAQSREREVASISKGLKDLAMSLDIPVIGLSQLNREVGSASRPMNYHLRESSALEHDADKIILMWRERMLKPDKQELDYGDAEVFVSKNRSGRIGDCYLRFIPEQITFRNSTMNLSSQYSDEDLF